MNKLQNYKLLKAQELYLYNGIIANGYKLVEGSVYPIIIKDNKKV